MIFVNYGGGGYWFFAHSRWHGLTVADLVMPWFMFLMGSSFSFSFSSMKKRQLSKIEMTSKVIIRSVKLFLIGLCLINNNLSWQQMRIPGVLQRFSISYLAVGLLHIFLQPTQPNDSTFGDIVQYWPQWVFIGAIELIWLLVTYTMPVPGCPTGYLGPGGLNENSQYYNCTGGAARWIDIKIFGHRHIFEHVTSREIFQIETYYGFKNDEIIQYDPCGLLGSINSIVIVFLGLQAGKILTHHKTDKHRLLRFFFWGCK